MTPPPADLPACVLIVLPCPDADGNTHRYVSLSDYQAGPESLNPKTQETKCPPRRKCRSNASGRSLPEA